MKKTWNKISETPIPTDKFVWLWREDMKEPIMGFCLGETDKIYDEHNCCLESITHWRQILKPVPPDGA